MAGEALAGKTFAANPCKELKLPAAVKRRRNQRGTPGNPEADVIALSPRTLLATNRFLCEICGKGFQRDQNLQLHRRGHDLPWKLRQRSSMEPRKKRVYVCPERSCVHHHPSRALGDLTGIKKHFCRKHGEKKWKCDKCSKRYAVQSDWKAHMKTCGTREYRCDCGTVFSRRDSFIIHRAFCDALAEETARISAASNMGTLTSTTSTNESNQQQSAVTRTTKPHDMVQPLVPPFLKPINSNGEVADEVAPSCLSLWMGQARDPNHALLTDPQHFDHHLSFTSYDKNFLCRSYEELTSTSLHHGLNSNAAPSVPSMYSMQQEKRQRQTGPPAADMSATALLQKAAQIGATTTTDVPSSLLWWGCGLKEVGDGGNRMEGSCTKYGGKTRDFLGVGAQTAPCPPPPIHGRL